MESKKDVWIKALRTVTNHLDKNHCKYFLDTGTLLGAIRENGFIEWDNDIDLSVVDCESRKNTIKRVSESIYKEGYNVTATKNGIAVTDNAKVLDLSVKFYYHEDGVYYSTLNKVKGSNICNTLLNVFEDKILFKNGYGCFIFKVFCFKLLKPIKCFIPLSLRNVLIDKANVQTQKIVIPEQYFSHFVKVEMYGEQFKVPQKHEEYLEYRYGKNWRIPKQSYNYIDEDGSIQRE